jgi:D-glycero-D-manno-heptose 1,7-bisphosphate phosphatase
MQEELRQNIGYEIDVIYYCPHNWDEGCECRKPKPGMFYKAQKDFSLNLTNCIMVGDDERDMEAGLAAGCVCYQVTEDNSLLDIVKNNIIK